MAGLALPEQLAILDGQWTNQVASQPSDIRGNSQELLSLLLFFKFFFNYFGDFWDSLYFIWHIKKLLVLLIDVLDFNWLFLFVIFYTWW